MKYTLHEMPPDFIANHGDIEHLLPPLVWPL